MEDVRRSDFEVKEFDEVMDFMQEEDDLIAPSTDSFIGSAGDQLNELNFDFTESMKGLTLADSTEKGMSREQVCQPSDSFELEAKNRNRKCNLRKSLAWDRAFFTSAGVLDPEELSSMIGVGEIGGRKLLSGIQEDDMRSSVSTLDSDSLTIESLEAELFQDIRASIQKSNKVVSNIPPNNMSSFLGESHISIPSLAKTDHSSESKAKLVVKSTTKMLNICAIESLSKRNQSHLEVSQDNHDGKCKGTLLFPTKLPNGPGKPSAILSSPAKRVSANVIHTTNGKTVPKCLIGAARGALVKLPASSKPALPRPTAVAKISVSVSSKDTKKDCSVIRSSAESSSSLPSSNSANFPMDSVNKNIASKSTKPPAASTSIVRIPSKTKSKDCNPPALKTKVQSVHSRLTASVKSTPTNISSISPASSISDWSNESSSSTSTVYQRSNNQRACAESFCLSISGAGEVDYPLAFDSHEELRDLQIRSDANTSSSPSNNVTYGPKKHSSLPHPVAAKPSGLRIPSPKIGFFDGVKSLPRTPRRSVQVNRGMPSGLAKGEGICIPTGGSSKAKIGKFQPQTIAGCQKKDDAQPAVSVLKHVPHIPVRKLPNSLMKKPRAPEAANNDASLSSKLEKDVSPKTGGKSHFNMSEVSTVILEGNCHDRFPRRKNDTRTGVVCTVEDSTSRFHSSLAEDSAKSMAKVFSKIDHPETERLVKTKEAASETKIRPKGSFEANSKGLNFQSRTWNDGETAAYMPEHNSSVNFYNGSHNFLNC